MNEANNHSLLNRRLEERLNQTLLDIASLIIEVHTYQVGLFVIHCKRNGVMLVLDLL